MAFETVQLNDNLSFVKYNELEDKKYVKLEKLPDSFVSAIKKFATFFSFDSEYQAYMIYMNDQLIGGIIIESLLNGTTLEFKYSLIEGMISSTLEEEIFMDIYNFLCTNYNNKQFIKASVSKSNNINNFIESGVKIKYVDTQYISKNYNSYVFKNKKYMKPFQKSYYI